MKRGFEECSELKETCGSQFLQYLAKVALVSRMALNEQKLTIYKEAISRRKKCAGCDMPATSTGVYEQCRYGCKQIVKCDWKFCKGSDDIHSCTNCGKEGLCVKDGSHQRHMMRLCRKCKKGLCSQCRYSACYHCNPMCKSCADPITTLTTLQVGPLYGEEKPLCSNHKSVLEQDVAFVLSCELCAPYMSNVARCKDFRCWRFICPHKGPSTLYCQEHVVDHK